MHPLALAHDRCRLLAGLLAVVLAMGVLSGCGSPRRPNVVLVLLDTLRADCVDPDASDPPMPFLSELAAQNLYYERAYAPTSWTLPSMASLFLAEHPSRHRVGEKGWSTGLPADRPTLAEVFRQSRYTTTARVVHPGLGSTRIGRGFDDFYRLQETDGHLDSQDLNRAAFTWIDARPEKAPPFFLYLHYLDVHRPYRVHPELTAPREEDAGRPDSQLGGVAAGRGLLVDRFRRHRLWRHTPGELKRMRQLYEGECRYLDRSMRALFEGLEARELLQRSVVVVVSDHGEEFGAHGVLGHGGSLFAASVRVPLIIRLPEPRAERVSAPVEIAGLGPALLRMLDIPVPPEFAVEALPLEEPSGGPRAAYFESAPSHLTLRLHSHGVADRETSLLVAEDGTQTRFALDPKGLEQRPLPPGESTEALRAGLARKRVEDGAPAPARTLELDPADREALRDLGYLE